MTEFYTVQGVGKNFSIKIEESKPIQKGKTFNFLKTVYTALTDEQQLSANQIQDIQKTTQIIMDRCRQKSMFFSFQAKINIFSDAYKINKLFVEINEHLYARDQAIYAPFKVSKDMIKKLRDFAPPNQRSQDIFKTKIYYFYKNNQVSYDQLEKKADHHYVPIEVNSTTCTVRLLRKNESADVIPKRNQSQFQPNEIEENYQTIITYLKSAVLAGE